jgi:hypothetical protein
METTDTASHLNSFTDECYLFTDECYLQFLMKDTAKRMLDHGFDITHWKMYSDLHHICSPLLSIVKSELEKFERSNDKLSSAFLEVLSGLVSEQIIHGTDEESIYFYVYFESVLNSVLKAIEESLRHDSQCYEHFPCALTKIVEETVTPRELPALTLDEVGFLQYYLMKDTAKRMLDHGFDIYIAD